MAEKFGDFQVDLGCRLDSQAYRGSAQVWSGSIGREVPVGGVAEVGELLPRAQSLAKSASPYRPS
jgi:hypothetical protein